MKRYLLIEIYDRPAEPKVNVERVDTYDVKTKKNWFTGNKTIYIGKAPYHTKIVITE